jgi:hypothetical protein
VSAVGSLRMPLSEQAIEEGIDAAVTIDHHLFAYNDLG